MESLKDDLKILNVKQLKKIISNSNIKNYSKLKKNELINLIVINKLRTAKKGTKPELLKPKTKIKVGRKFPPKSQPKSQPKSAEQKEKEAMEKEMKRYRTEEEQQRQEDYKKFGMHLQTTGGGGYGSHNLSLKQELERDTKLLEQRIRNEKKDLKRFGGNDEMIKYREKTIKNLEKELKDIQIVYKEKEKRNKEREKRDKEREKRDKEREEERRKVNEERKQIREYNKMMSSSVKDRLKDTEQASKAGLTIDEYLDNLL